MADFDVMGKGYELRYTIKRIEMYEAAHGSLMGAFARDGGNLSIAELRDLVSFGIALEGGGHVAPKQGAEMAEGLIEQNGYMPTFARVAEALERDCAFLFRMN